MLQVGHGVSATHRPAAMQTLKARRYGMAAVGIEW